MSIKTTRWDYDKNEAVQFERQGDCNRCGACCKAIINFIAYAQDNDPDDKDAEPVDVRNGGNWIDEKGVWNEVENAKGERRYFRFTEIDTSEETLNTHKCGHLITAEDGKPGCAVQVDKNLLCKSWPFAPEHVTPFPECSYTFVEVSRWPIVVADTKIDIQAEEKENG